ncbi:alpha-1,2-fucosyltransferase [Dysgonomonas sp. ZJ279]|uniref:alpha-1,2-fucosyltransferase n=1 Tax=Dysgonomonas sp. ZJ279 TaxID=2709796 RepID=UPI0013EAE6FD|nr:alpha-1,2-fucosyltransferase [Dysgonomonas sp. ZJ279]
MVTVILSGGLGNQMFQYAAAKGLAKRLNTSVAIDLYALEKKTQTTNRLYALDIFNIDEKITSSLKTKLFVKARPFIQKHYPFFQKLGFFSDRWAILYEPKFETLGGNIFMSGYFQSERYFKETEEDIRRDFTFRYPLDGKNLELSEEIKNTNSVAVHIRRGDYVTDKSAVNNFVTCDKGYYEKAIEIIRTKVVNPVFYIFSEDFDWVKENLSFGDAPIHYVRGNSGNKSYIDLQLMSLCKHNIIANSTFSWWAAWLNNNSDKIVIAPDKWYADENKNELLDEFYPKGWIKI